jgi:streptogramin lyase
MNRLASLSGFGLISLLLTGCSLAPSAKTPSHATGSLAGSIHGGQQPVSGATVTLLAPGVTGYGGSPVALTSTVSNAAGGFTLPGYTCPANNGVVYLLATGGDSGSGTNPALAEAAILGPCAQLTPATFINMSEATTVAAAFVLAPFAEVTTGTTGIGTSATNAQGLANVYAPASNLVNLQTGAARGPNELPGMTLPQAEIDTLADILAACVNSTGSVASTAPCGKLFAASTPASGVAPVDTFQAALNIALHPGANAAALFSLVAPAAPFQPALASAPTDFALAIQYSGAPFSTSYGTHGVAIDALGNAWVTTGDVIEDAGNTHVLTEISPAGSVSSFGSNALQSPEGVAIGTNGIYVTDAYAGTVVRFSSNGAVTGSYSPNSLFGPFGIAIDTDNSLWVENVGRAIVSHLSANGSNIAPSPYGTSANGSDIALNTQGIWVPEDIGPNGYMGHHQNGASPDAVLNYPVTGLPYGLALDSAGNIWFGASANGVNLLERLGANGVANLTPITLAAPLSPVELFIDGLGQVWISAYHANIPAAPGSLLEFSSSGALLSPTSGFSAGATIESSPGFPQGLAGDGSGNLWLCGVSESSSNTPQSAAYVTEIIGIAAPVVTPVAAAAASGMLGTRP